MKLKSLLLGLAFLSCLGPAKAQDGITVQSNKNAHKEWSYGPSKAGGFIEADTNIKVAYDNETGNAEVSGDATVRKTIRLFGWEAEVAKLQATGKVTRTGGVIEKDHKFRVTVLNGVVLFNENTPNISFGPHSLWILPGSGLVIPVPIGPVTVKIKANAKFSMQTGYGINVDPLAMSLQINGYGRAWATGTASASLSAVIASVGLSAELKLGDLKAEVNLRPTANGAEGELKTTLKPISVEMYIFVEIGIGWFSTEFTKKLFDWSYGQKVATTPLG